MKNIPVICASTVVENPAFHITSCQLLYQYRLPVILTPPDLRNSSLHMKMNPDFPIKLGDTVHTSQYPDHFWNSYPSWPSWQVQQMVISSAEMHFCSGDLLAHFMLGWCYLEQLRQWLTIFFKGISNVAFFSFPLIHLFLETGQQGNCKQLACPRALKSLAQSLILCLFSLTIIAMWI